MKPLIIGQAPGRRGDGEPLSGMAGRRLAALCCLELEELLDRFERVNLLKTFPGKSGKGDAFPLAEARTAAVGLLSAVAAHRHTILLGSNVARAFQLHRLPLLEWRDAFRDLGSFVAVCPHPSGVNRWWNDSANFVRASRFWRDLAR
jgi:uracil-DNA glycosylase